MSRRFSCSNSLPSRLVKTPGPPSRGRVAPTISDNSSGESFRSIHMLLDTNAARSIRADTSSHLHLQLASVGIVVSHGGRLFQSASPTHLPGFVLRQRRTPPCCSAPAPSLTTQS